MKVFRPHTMKGRVITAKGDAKSSVGGSILLGNVGSGSASSWSSMDSYLKDVGHMRPSPKMVGSGLGGELERKLQKLQVQGKKKPKNITLDL
jgi:hypothetical protein